MSEKSQEIRKALVVLGMHRSGTSAMAGVLGLSGATYPADPLPVGIDNEKGFWESLSIVSLNDEMLSASDSAWDDIFAGRPRRYLSNYDRVFHHKAALTLSHAFGDADVIVLKDPRINVLAAFWNSALEAAGYEPTYIIMVRHPLEVAASLRDRNKLPLETALLLWLDNMCAAERDTRGTKRVFVLYSELLNAWRGCIDRVEATAGFPLPRRTAAASNEISRFLSSRLRHHQVDAAKPSELTSFPHVAQAYAWFLEAARDSPPEDASPLARASNLMNELNTAIGPVLADLRSQVKDALGSSARQSERFEVQVAELKERARTLEVDQARLVANLAETEQLRVRNEALHLEHERLVGVSEVAHSRFHAIERNLEAMRYELEAAGSERDALRGVLEDERRRHEIETADLLTQAATSERRREALEIEVNLLRHRHEHASSELDRLKLASDASQSLINLIEGDLEATRCDREAIRGERDGLHRLLENERQRGEAEATELRILAETAERTREALEAHTQAVTADLLTQRDALLLQREALLTSTTWRLTEVPRRLFSLLRG